MVATINAMERDLQGEAIVDLDDILTDRSTPRQSLGRHTAAILCRDDVVAQTEVRGRRVEFAVHPDHRGRGLGTALLTWAEGVARDEGTTDLFQLTSNRDRAAIHLLESKRYAPRATAWILRIALAEAPSAPRLSKGYAFEPFVRDRDERVGAAIGAIYSGEGWVVMLAVARGHRRRGLGRALLEESFRRFRERGASSAALDTNSETGALGLYERADMRVVHTFTRRGKTPYG